MYSRYLSYILLLIAGLISAGQSASAQKYSPLPPDLDGSMMPFDFSRCTQAPDLPDSLRPVYASYVARHGARFISSPKKVEQLYKTLEKGRNQGILSDTGEEFLLFLDKIIAANTGNWGDLSPVGVEEQKKLGSRVFDILSPLGRDNTRVSAISSFVPRSVMTMYQLTNQLIRLNDSIVVKTDEGHQFSPLLRCFTADSRYAEYRKNGDWIRVYDDFVNRYVPAAPARRLFSRTSLADSQLRKLSLDIYEVLKANRAASLPAPTTQWMTADEYRLCWKASNLALYLRNNVTPLSSLAAQASAPLLIDLINTTDRAIASLNPQPALNGYFGHAETLLPLFSLMKLPGCFALTSDYDHLDRIWKVQDITPLGANLLILVTRAPSGNHYVSLQLNGRTIRPMPGRPDIVAWSDLRQFWIKILADYGIPFESPAPGPYLE